MAFDSVKLQSHSGKGLYSSLLFGSLLVENTFLLAFKKSTSPLIELPYSRFKQLGSISTGHDPLMGTAEVRDTSLLKPSRSTIYA